MGLWFLPRLESSIALFLQSPRLISAIKHGKPYFARVSLKVTELHQTASSTTNTILISCTGDPKFYGQDQYNEASPTGDMAWKEAAKAGVRFALKAAGKIGYKVEVTRILGRYALETNPTIVCYAAALALWKALNFEVSAELTIWCESEIFTSWRKPEVIPNWLETCKLVIE